jgi:hypothetical protein
MTREYRVMSALASVGILVLFETDPSLIGSPFFVGTASVR